MERSNSNLAREQYNTLPREPETSANMNAFSLNGNVLFDNNLKIVRERIRAEQELNSYCVKVRDLILPLLKEAEEIITSINVDMKRSDAKIKNSVKEYKKIFLNNITRFSELVSGIHDYSTLKEANDYFSTQNTVTLDTTHDTYIVDFIDIIVDLHNIYDNIGDIFEVAFNNPKLIKLYEQLYTGGRRRTRRTKKRRHTRKQKQNRNRRH
jgi:hypothetical protein